MLPNLRGHSSIEFTYSLTQDRMLIGAPTFDLPTPPPPGKWWSPHQQLALLLGHDPIVDVAVLMGGAITRNPDDPMTTLTNEASGHYFEAWTDANRQIFIGFLQSLGFAVKHSEE